jgi:hypothetical protein
MQIEHTASFEREFGIARQGWKIALKSIISELGAAS